ncbi:MAG: hypothetical protein ACYS0E_00435 [Planctomycetota bacterium]|jgi:hypothetical protein
MIRREFGRTNRFGTGDVQPRDRSIERCFHSPQVGEPQVREAGALDAFEGDTSAESWSATRLTIGRVRILLRDRLTAIRTRRSKPNIRLAQRKTVRMRIGPSAFPALEDPEPAGFHDWDGVGPLFF